MGRKQWIILLLILSGITAGRKAVVETFEGFKKPEYFPEPVYHFKTNPVTKDGFELGRKLFYDPLLSADTTISCGSCHIQTSSFTQHGHRLSHGIHDQLGIRNSPPIFNLAWSNSFMWDGGIADLDLQPIFPITSHVEMGDSMENVLRKLKAHPQYPLLFKKAFGSKEITTSHFLKALSQFMVMCVSNNAKYDSVMRKQSSFTDAEAAGYEVFKQKCGQCHKEPLFTDYSYRNNGLEITAQDDKGRYSITLNDNDKYKFKVPSLRNLMYTPPYMHDGRLFTIESCITHYTSRVKKTPNLDPSLQQNMLPGLIITAAEKNNLLAFLNTLNDRSFLLDKKLAEQ